jgi:uncharacterized membrane-anchored protein
MSDYGADFLTETETIEGTWEYGEQEFDLLVEDISIGSFELLQKYTQVAQEAAGVDGEASEDDLEAVNQKAEDLDPLPWEDEVEADGFLEATIEAKLVKPDVVIADARAHKLRAVFEGMIAAWQEGNQ